MNLPILDPHQPWGRFYTISHNIIFLTIIIKILIMIITTMNSIMITNLEVTSSGKGLAISVWFDSRSRTWFFYIISNPSIQRISMFMMVITTVWTFTNNPSSQSSSQSWSSRLWQKAMMVLTKNPSSLSTVNSQLRPLYSTWAIHFFTLGGNMITFLGNIINIFLDFFLRIWSHFFVKVFENMITFWCLFFWEIQGVFFNW